MKEEILKNVRSYPIAIQYEFSIDDYIEDPCFYREELNVLRNANQGDQIHIYINTMGGRTDTAIAFIHAMLACQGDVYTHLEGSAYSAGSMLFLAGHIPVIYPLADMMSHTYSGGIAGKAPDIKAKIFHSSKTSRQLIELVYQDFLTESEIEKMLDGKDYYFDFDEICERLDKREKIRKERDKAEMDQLPAVSREELLKLTKKEILNTLLGPEDVEGV